MQNKLLIFMLVVSPMVSSSQHLPSNSCHEFFKGKFIVEGKEHIKIRRTARYQYETDSRNKIRSKYKIKWVNDCTCTITLVRTTDRDLISRDKIDAVQPQIIRVINGNKYTYTTSYSFMSGDRCGTLRRTETKEETLIKIR